MRKLLGSNNKQVELCNPADRQFIFGCIWNDITGVRNDRKRNGITIASLTVEHSYGNFD